MLVPSNSANHMAQSILGMRPIVAKLKYPDIFEFSGDLARQENIIGAFISSSAIVHGGMGSLKRMWLSDYDPQKITPPVCSSSDGKSGSHASTSFEEICKEIDIPLSRAVMTEFGNRRIFGDCDSCFFNQFNTAGLWKNQPRKGKQCGDNSLIAWLMVGGPQATFEFGLPVVQQISSVGSNVISSIASASRQKSAYPQDFLWRLEPTGGGRNGRSMAVFVIRPLSEDERQIIQLLRPTYDAMMQNFVTRFAAGEDIKDETAEAATEEVAHDIPF